MTDHRELTEIAEDVARARSTAAHLLKLGDVDWTGWELDFLETMRSREEELSTRQNAIAKPRFASEDGS